MKMKKKILIILTIAIAIVGIGYGIGNYFVSYALSPTSDSDQREISSEDAIELESHTKQQIEKNKEIEKQKGIQFSKKTQETSLQSLLYTRGATCRHTPVRHRGNHRRNDSRSTQTRQSHYQ